jgi:hypothetical protein
MGMMVLLGPARTEKPEGLLFSLIDFRDSTIALFRTLCQCPKFPFSIALVP